MHCSVSIQVEQLDDRSLKSAICETLEQRVQYSGSMCISGLPNVIDLWFRKHQAIWTLLMHQLTKQSEMSA